MNNFYYLKLKKEFKELFRKIADHRIGNEKELEYIKKIDVIYEKLIKYENIYMR